MEKSLIVDLPDGKQVSPAAYLFEARKGIQLEPVSGDEYTVNMGSEPLFHATRDEQVDEADFLTSVERKVTHLVNVYRALYLAKLLIYRAQNDEEEINIETVRTEIDESGWSGEVSLSDVRNAFPIIRDEMQKTPDLISAFHDNLMEVCKV